MSGRGLAHPALAPVAVIVTLSVALSVCSAAAPSSQLAGSRAVVVLPPSVPPDAKSELRDQAQSACDRLEASLAKVDKLTLVNRGELNRVIQEQKLSPNPGRPVLSYDAMLRLKVEADELLPHASLALVDLSTGNPLQTWTVDWPLNDKQLAEVVSEIPAKLARSEGAGAGRLKLRLVGVQAKQSRMAPLGLRLEKVFVDALGQSKDMLLVQHLEAASAQEESLLLLMGFSRLGDQRQFVPQADATLELEIGEADEVGMAFEDAPIAISFRLRRGAASAGEWTRVTGLVRNCDDLAKQAWEAMTKQLDKADAGVGAKMLDDLSLRRKQALTELQGVESVLPEQTSAQELRARLAHIDAALKLDPCCEPAVYLRFTHLWRLCQPGAAKDVTSQDVRDLLLTTVRYCEQFPQNAARNKEATLWAAYAVSMTPLGKLGGKDDVPMTLDVRVLLDAAKRLVELSARGAPERLTDSSTPLMAVVYRGMRKADVSVAQREEWIDSILAGRRKQLAQFLASRRTEGGLATYWLDCIYIAAAQLAAEDGRAERTKELLAFVRRQVEGPASQPTTRGAVRSESARDLASAMRKVLVTLKDPAALAEFDAWAKGDTRTPGRPIRFDDVCPIVYGVGSGQFKPLEITCGQFRNGPWALSPLCEGGGYLYALTWKRADTITWGLLGGGDTGGVAQEIVRIPLNDAGRPMGAPLPNNRNTQPGQETGWDSLERLPRPPVNKTVQVHCGRFVDGRLCLGTAQTGLLVLDAGKKEWQAIGPADGLPCQSVYTMHPQENATLFCTGLDALNDGSTVCVYFTYAVKTGEIRVLRRVSNGPGAVSYHLLLDVWKHDGKLLGLTAYGGVTEVLAGDHKDDLQVAGYRCRCARVGESLFVGSRGNVVELGLDGKVQSRLPMGDRGMLPGSPSRWMLPRFRVPADTPAQGDPLSDGHDLWFGENWVLYDSQLKTWYGPLLYGNTSAQCLVTSAGLWIGAERAMRFIDRQKYIDAAVAADRATTTEEFIKRRDAIIAQMPPVQQARVLLGQRKFAQAKVVLDPYLAGHRDEPIAILLMGMINDSWGLKNQAVAAECYQRLEGMTDPSVKFTGLCMEVPRLVQAAQWEQAKAALKRLRDAFPVVADEYQHEVSDWSRQIDKALATTGASRLATTGAGEPVTTPLSVPSASLAPAGGKPAAPDSQVQEAGVNYGLVIAGAVLLVALAGIGATLVWRRRPGSAAGERFLAAIASGDPGRVTAMFDPALGEDVDEPMLAAWLTAINKHLGGYQGLSKADFDTSVRRENGWKIMESSGTVNFEKGQAQAKLVARDGKLMKFHVTSDRLPADWFTGPAGTELYRERGKAFLAHLMSNEPDAAFGMMHSSLRERMPLDKLTKLVASNSAKAGMLRTVTYQTEKYDPKDQTLEVHYALECEKVSVQPRVKFKLAGLKGRLVTFSLSGS